MKIYVGNLSYDLSENDLKDVFTPYGEVASVKIMTDKFTGRSKGFAFVEILFPQGGVTRPSGQSGHGKARDHYDCFHDTLISGCFWPEWRVALPQHLTACVAAMQ